MVKIKQKIIFLENSTLLETDQWFNFLHVTHLFKTEEFSTETEIYQVKF